MRVICEAVLISAVVGILTCPVLAQGPGAADSSGQTAAAGQGEFFPMSKALSIIGSCLGAALCTVAGGYGIARIGASCIESIARQPEAGAAMFAPMVVAAAMVEGGMLFAIVVCLLGVLGA